MVKLVVSDRAQSTVAHKASRFVEAVAAIGTGIQTIIGQNQ
jgi:hypothetical protein